MNARNLNNLAGKYVTNYGTPFDLQELENTTGLDINNITHIRLVDVVGSIDKHAATDKDGNIINDPYPTAFPTGGFDLDALAVLHQGALTVAGLQTAPVKIYPNPADDYLVVGCTAIVKIMVRDVRGKLVYSDIISGPERIDISAFTAGLYFMEIISEKGNRWQQRFIKR
jgi:hypothetical protein